MILIRVTVIDKFHFLIFQQATTVHPVVDVSNTDSTGNVMQKNKCVLYSTGRSAIFSVAGNVLTTGVCGNVGGYPYSANNLCTFGRLLAGVKCRFQTILGYTWST